MKYKEPHDNPKYAWMKPPEHIIIDRQEHLDGIWWHLGNMYWCPEYKPFYDWLVNKRIEEITDFPHHWFRFIDETHEKEFLDKWKDYIKLDTNNID